MLISSIASFGLVKRLPSESLIRLLEGMICFCFTHLKTLLCTFLLQVPSFILFRHALILAYFSFCFNEQIFSCKIFWIAASALSVIWTSGFHWEHQGINLIRSATFCWSLKVISISLVFFEGRCSRRRSSAMIECVLLYHELEELMAEPSGVCPGHTTFCLKIGLVPLVGGPFKKTAPEVFRISIPYWLIAFQASSSSSTWVISWYLLRQSSSPICWSFWRSGLPSVVLFSLLNKYVIPKSLKFSHWPSKYPFQLNAPMPIKVTTFSFWAL